MLGSSVTLLLLTLALGWSIFFKAGVWPADWDVTLSVVGLVSAGYWLFRSRSRFAPPLKASLKWPIFLFPCYLVFQLVPFPIPVLHVLSPARADLVTTLAPAVPNIHFAPISLNPPLSVLYLFTFLGYTATFLLTRELAWQFSSRPWTVAVPLIVIAALEAAVGMLQVFFGWPSAEATGTYTNRDHFCGLLEMVLPFAVLYGLAVLRKTQARFDSPALPALAACSIWAIAALLLVAIIYSLSRMGFLDGLCVLFFIGALSIGPRLPSRTWRLYSLGAIGLTVLLMFVFFPPNQLIARFADLSSSGQVTANTRLSLWKETFPLISEFPLFGTGLGGYESPFLKYQTAVAGFRVEFAHNDYLQYLAELGVVGFALLALLLTGIVVQIFRGILKLGDEERRLLVIACAGAFLAIGLHSLVDFNMYIPGNAMTLAWIGGIASLNGLD